MIAFVLVGFYSLFDSQCIIITEVFMEEEFMEDGSGAVGLQLVCTQRSERTGAPQYCYLRLYICARTLGPGSMVKKSEAMVVPTSSGF